MRLNVHARAPLACAGALALAAAFAAHAAAGTATPAAAGPAAAPGVVPAATTAPATAAPDSITPAATAAAGTATAAPATRAAPAGHTQSPTPISFDPATGTITLKLPERALGSGRPANIHSDSFVVHDDGVLQRDVAVHTERASLSLGVLLESGGHYPSLSQALSESVIDAAQQLLSRIGPDDRVAVWKYGQDQQQLSDFGQDPQTLTAALGGLGAPAVSELDLYDALIATLQKMRAVEGPKAIILVSTGVDTLSKATREQALQALRRDGVPVYVIDLAATAQSGIITMDSAYPRVNWQRGESVLRQIAAASGGRLYAPGFMFDLAGFYDQLMASLRTYFVITYKPALLANLDRPRTVRVELRDPVAEAAAKTASGGKPVRRKLVAENRYVPSAAATHTAPQPAA